MTTRDRDYGDLLVLMALAGFTLWYLFDAIRVSSAVQNLLLILPLALIVLTIVLLELVVRLRKGTLLARPEDEPLRQTLPVVGLFAAYVISLETLGFDVATVLFIAAFLMLKGERNWLLLAGYSLAFGFGVAYFFALMLPYPMHMLILQG